MTQKLSHLEKLVKEKQNLELKAFKEKQKKEYALILAEEEKALKYMKITFEKFLLKFIKENAKNYLPSIMERFLHSVDNTPALQKSIPAKLINFQSAFVEYLATDDTEVNAKVLDSLDSYIQARTKTQNIAVNPK
jgi:hypothetical protein